MAATPLDEIVSTHAALNETFLATTASPALAPKISSSTSPYPLLSVPYREHQIRQVARLVQDNADAICSALAQDFGKPRQEVILTEVGAVIERALLSAAKVKEWVGDEDGLEDIKTVGWQEAWKAKIERRAKGVALIIS
jgi:aldehyde dehydrogenase (NAD+)